MKNKKILALAAMAISLSCIMTACSFGGDDPEEQVVVETTPTPEPTNTPDPTPTIAPDAQSTTYTSKDKSVSIELPDATWANKTDEEDMVSFESPDQGKILILHGQGEEDMSVAVIPSSQDMAVSLEQAADLEQGTDFEIQDYTANDVNGIGVYSYVTKMLNPEKNDGNVYVVNKVFANAEEFYSISGSVKTEEALAKVKSAVDSFKILGSSTLKEAAPGSAAGTDADGNTGAAGTEGQGTDQGTEGQNTDSQGTESTTSSAGEISDAAMSDTSQTRTIYRNSDGHPLVIQADGNGNWVDSDGNTYDFATDEDVYDQDGVDYYYHGEAADVYYMPLPSDDDSEDYYEE